MMRDLFKTAILKQSLSKHVLSDEAVKEAVNLGAQVHNLLSSYEQALKDGDFTQFSTRLYELSFDFHEPKSQENRENMRLEYVRRSLNR